MSVTDEFKKKFDEKLSDLTDVLFQGFKAGVYDNKYKSTFTEGDITSSIKISTNHSLINITVEYSKFVLVFKEKASILKEQVFYALDKGIFDNKIHLRFSEGSVYCSMTLKTSARSEEERALRAFINDSSNDQDKERMSEDSNLMSI